jgi:rhodanese-related sulfurtransferase
MIIKRTLYEAMLIIVSAVVISLMVNALRPEGIDLFGHDKKTPAKAEIGFTIIDTETAIAKYKAGEGLFVDAREAEIFAAGHIKNAVNLPDQQFDEWINDFIGKTHPQTQIITYCDGIDCSQAKDLAEKLCLIGYESVFYFQEGYEAWVKRRMEIQSDLDNAINR